MPWTALQPSLRARRWRHVGLGIALASSLALLIAAVSSAPFDPALALLAAIAGCAGAIASTRERISAPLEVGISSLGEIRLREREPVPSGVTPGLPEPGVHIAFASTWLISLRRGTMLIPIWPDSLPQSTYRRLCVHLWWGRATLDDDDQRTTTTNCANSKDR